MYEYMHKCMYVCNSFYCACSGSKAASGLQERLLGETVVYSPMTASHPEMLEDESEEDNIASVDQFAEQLVKESEVYILCMYVCMYV